MNSNADLAPSGQGNLERSCGSGLADRMRIGELAYGIERMEARFHGKAFSPHRHDTYGLGLTLHGVQTFRYRGVERFSNAGNVIVLHPDELHDGAAGTEDGLIYRIIYLPPKLISAVDDHRAPLPFVPNPVLTDGGIRQALGDILYDLDEEPSDLMMDDVIMRLAAGLSQQAGEPGKRLSAAARSAVVKARDLLEDRCAELVSSEILEAETGLDRYELARQFRRLMGTSPHRYLVMRRLERAKRSMVEGQGLAETAADAGFADQAHFTRHFRKAFGMTPGHWLGIRTGNTSSR